MTVFTNESPSSFMGICFLNPSVDLNAGHQLNKLLGERLRNLPSLLSIFYRSFIEDYETNSCYTRHLPKCIERMCV